MINIRWKYNLVVRKFFLALCPGTVSVGPVALFQRVQKDSVNVGCSLQHSSKKWGKKWKDCDVALESKRSRIMVIKLTVARPPQEVKAEIWSIAALFMISSSQRCGHGRNSLISSALNLQPKRTMKEGEKACEVWPLLPWIVQNRVGKLEWQWPTLPQQGRQADWRRKKKMQNAFVEKIDIYYLWK